MNPTYSNNGNNADFADFGIEGDVEKHFPAQCLPPIAKNYLDEIVRVYHPPQALPGAIMLGTLSGAIGSGVKIRNSKTVTTGNLYVAVGAKSGTGKTLCFDLITGPLFEYEGHLIEQWRHETLPKAKVNVQVLTRDRERVEKLVSKQESAEMKASYMQQLIQIELDLAKWQTLLEAPRRIFADVTREKLADLLQRSPTQTMAGLSGEARGCVDVFLGRYASTPGIDILTQGWSLDPVKVSRLGRPEIYVRNPCLSLVWLMQPDVMETLLSHPVLSDSGLLARFLILDAKASHEEQSENVPPLKPEVQQQWNTLIKLAACHVHSRNPALVVRCNPEVEALIEKLRKCLEKRQQAGGDLADVDIFAARWVEQTWRIMLNLHVGEFHEKSANIPISLETAQKAIQLMDWFATQQLLLLTAKREKRNTDRQEQLTTILSRKPGQSCSLRDMRRRHGFEEEEIVKIASDLPELYTIRTLPQNGPGRPSRIVELAQA